MRQNLYGSIIGLILFFLTISPRTIRTETSSEKPVYGAPESFPEIHGFVHLEIEDAQGEKSAYELDHIVLGISSNIGENSKVFLELFNQEKGNEKITLFQAFGSWNFDPALKLNMGLFMIPFALQDSTYYCPLRFFNHRPWAIEDIIPTAWHDIGIKLDGTLPVSIPGKLAYDLALTTGISGTGISGHREVEAEDINQNKMLTTRLNYYFEPGWNIGTSYTSGKYDPSSKFNIDFFGLHLRKESERWNLEGGFVQRQTEDSGGIQGAESWYLEGNYQIPMDKKWAEKLGIGASYEEIDPNNKISDNQDQTRLKLGFKLVVSKEFDIRLDHAWVGEKHGQSIPNDGWMIGGVFSF